MPQSPSYSLLSSDVRVAYSRREWAMLCGVGLSLINSAIRNGDLKTIKIGRRRLILREHGISWLSSRSTTA